jgi:hypothetical protein
MNFNEGPLFNLCRSISKGTGLTPFDVLIIGNSAYYRYKKYTIAKKKKGEFRTIGHPAKEVKLLQRWVIDNLLFDLPIHECATAYVKGSSIKRNVSAHVSSNYLLKLDFSGFFPSLVPKDFIHHFKKHKNGLLSQEELKFVAKILFWKENRHSDLSMSIGAPSSPILSNTLMYDFDIELNADDLCISSNKKNTLAAYEFVRSLIATIQYPRVKLNESKTLFLSKANRRRVTGLIISNNNKVSLGRDRKRLISSMVHHFLCDKLNEGDVFKLKGLLAFARDIEPQFIHRLVDKYGQDNILKLIIEKVEL